MSIYNVEIYKNETSEKKVPARYVSVRIWIVHA